MKILKKAKKGFTIVELVIVIAVIAVLAAVLIPTFINLTAKANKAADESLVTSLNKALAIEEVDHDIDNMHDAVECLKKEGYLVSTLVTKSDQKLLYDLDKNRFLLEEDKDSDKDDYEYWTIADSYDATKQKYSIYATDTFSTEEVSGLKVGFDAGDCTTVKRIDYVGTGSAQKVIIRSYDGIVTVNAPTDVVKHYKYADALNIVAVAPSSYHEYGTVGFAQMASGHFVAEDGAQVVKMHIASNDADIKVEKKAIVDFWSKESTVTTAVVNENGQAKDIASIDNETIADFEEAASSYVESQVCKIGELRYASLQEAVNAAKEGEQIDLIKNLTQEAGILVDKNGVSFKLDLCGHTFKVTKGNNVSWRAVKVVGGTIAISNGEIDARNETSITSGTGNGAYGTVRIEPDTGKQAKAILTDLTLYNNHHFGLSVKACTNGFAELTRCAVYSDVGGGIEADGGTAVIKDCSFIGTNGNLNTTYPHCASAIAVSGTDYGETGDQNYHLGVVDVYNSEFTSSALQALYVYTSGGTLNVHSGKFFGTNAVAKVASTPSVYPYAVAIINIYNGEFDGSLSKDSHEENEINISAGSFTVDPTAYVLEGKTVTQSGGKYIVA